MVCNLIGGITYPLQKMALRGLPPVTVSALRSALGLALMAGWLAARGKRLWPFDARDQRLLGILGIFGMALPILAGAEGVQRSTSANASVLILLEPVSIVLFARLLLGERMGGRRAAGLALGLAGALAIVTEGFTAGPDLLGGEHLLGNGLLALSGILWGLYTPLMKPLTGRHDPVALALGAIAFSVLFFAGPAAGELRGFHPGPGLGEALLCTAALGVLGSFLGTVLWTAALKDIPANAVAPLILLQPVVGAGTGWLLLGERLTLQAALGGALVGAGVLLSLSGEEPAATPPQRSPGLPSGLGGGDGASGSMS